MSEQQHLTSYDAGQKQGRLLGYLGEVVGYPRLAWRHRSLVSNFLKRDLQGRFRGSALGMLWVLAHPMFLFVTYWLVFGIMFAVRGNPALGELWYPIYLFSGILAWTVFTDISIRGTSLIVENGNLIEGRVPGPDPAGAPGPRPDAIVYGVGLLCSPSWRSARARACSRCTAGPGLLALPLVLVELFLFSVGMALLLARCVFARDVSKIFPIIANLWFFAKPGVPGDAMFATVDEHGQVHNRIEALWPILQANPLNPILQANRAALGIVIDGRSVPTLEVFHLAFLALVPSVVTFVLGFVVFRSLQRRFADEGLTWSAAGASRWRGRQEVRLYGTPVQRLLEKLPGARPRHRKVQALADVTFHVERATTVGIVGPNGAGKSTLLKILTGTTARRRAATASPARSRACSSSAPASARGLHRPREHLPQRLDDGAQPGGGRGATLDRDLRARPVPRQPDPDLLERHDLRLGFSTAVAVDPGSDHRRDPRGGGHALPEEVRRPNLAVQGAGQVDPVLLALAVRRAPDLRRGHLDPRPRPPPRRRRRWHHQHSYATYEEPDRARVRRVHEPARRGGRRRPRRPARRLGRDPRPRIERLLKVKPGAGHPRPGALQELPGRPCRCASASASRGPTRPTASATTEMDGLVLDQAEGVDLDLPRLRLLSGEFVCFVWLMDGRGVHRYHQFLTSRNLVV
ncbi:MAG: ATP-binding cassette domain-containing protein [Planctomycetota bacterium]